MKSVLAVAVGPTDAIRDCKKLVDEVVCLETPKHFQAVGQFYSDFSQISDSEVAQILTEK